MLIRVYKCEQKHDIIITKNDWIFYKLSGWVWIPSVSTISFG